MSLQASDIRRPASGRSASRIRRVPTANRDLATEHAALIHRRVNRRALAISMFAFFATIFTLFWFSLTNSPVLEVDAAKGAGESAEEADGAEPGPVHGNGVVTVAATAIPDPAEIAVAPGQVVASGRPAVPQSEEYEAFYFSDENVTNWLHGGDVDQAHWTGHH